MRAITHTSARSLAGALGGAALMLAATSCINVAGSGTVVSRQIEATTFTKIDVSGAFAVDVTVGSPEQVTVRIDDNLVDSLDVAVTGDTLHIGLKSGTQISGATLEADVTVGSLAALDVSGASSVTVAGQIAVDPMSITVSGASQLTASIDVREGDVELSGASHAVLSGSAETLGVTVTGASNLDAPQLTVGDLTIDVSGVSHAETAVTGTLSASASGASAIRYLGSPTISRSDASGASTIQPSA